MLYSANQKKWLKRFFVSFGSFVLFLFLTYQLSNAFNHPLFTGEAEGAFVLEVIMTVLFLAAGCNKISEWSKNEDNK
jgi:hypothetical protein